MAYEMIVGEHLHMPYYFFKTFTEYPYKGWQLDSLKAIKASAIKGHIKGEDKKKWAFFANMHFLLFD